MCAIGRARARTLVSHGGGGGTGSAPFALLTAVVSGRALAAGFSAQLVFLEVIQFFGRAMRAKGGAQEIDFFKSTHARCFGV